MEIAEALPRDTNRIPKPAQTTPAALAKHGESPDLGCLTLGQDLTYHLCRVWYGINDGVSLGQFFASGIYWGEVDVLNSPMVTPVSSVKHTHEGRYPNLCKLLSRFDQQGRGIRLDIKRGGRLIEEVLDAASSSDDKRLWFKADVQTLRNQGFRALAQAHPGSVVQCPIDFLSPLLLVSPRKTESILDMLSDWGINRFSLHWETCGRRKIVEKLYRWGFQITIVGAPNLEAEILVPLPVPPFPIST